MPSGYDKQPPGDHLGIAWAGKIALIAIVIIALAGAFGWVFF